MDVKIVLENISEEESHHTQTTSTLSTQGVADFMPSVTTSPTLNATAADYIPENTFVGPREMVCPETGNSDRR